MAILNRFRGIYLSATGIDLDKAWSGPKKSFSLLDYDWETVDIASRILHRHSAAFGVD